MIDSSLSCDDYIKKLECVMNDLKKLRNQFKDSKISTPNYESGILSDLSLMQAQINGIRHTYLPLKIPEYFQVQSEPPKWANLSREEGNRFSEIAIENDNKQKELLQNFRRPGMRKSEIQNMAKALSLQQNFLKEDMRDQQLNVIFNSLVEKSRLKIKKSKSSSKMLTKSIKDYIEGNEIDIPQDYESTSLLVLSLFSDEGPLSEGIKCKSIETENSLIAGSIAEIVNSVGIDDIIGMVRPYVADLHFNELKEPTSEHCIEITKALGEAIELLGDDVSMADFNGEDIQTDILVSESLRKLHKFECVENLVVRLDDIGDYAIESSKNKQTASQMIAVSIISQQLIDFPLDYIIAISWCSDKTLKTFKNKLLFIHAFDEILNLIQEF